MCFTITATELQAYFAIQAKPYGAYVTNYSDMTTGEYKRKRRP